MDLFTPSSPGVFQLCLWPLIAPGYLGEVCHASHQPSDASTPLEITKTIPTLTRYHDRERASTIRPTGGEIRTA